MKDINPIVMIGKTISAIEHAKGEYVETITFKTTDGKSYLMHHDQDCCESVMVTLNIGVPLLFLWFADPKIQMRRLQVPE